MGQAFINTSNCFFSFPELKRFYSVRRPGPRHRLQACGHSLLGPPAGAPRGRGRPAPAPAMGPGRVARPAAPRATEERSTQRAPRKERPCSCGHTGADTRCWRGGRRKGRAVLLATRPLRSYTWRDLGPAVPPGGKTREAPGSQRLKGQAWVASGAWTQPLLRAPERNRRSVGSRGAHWHAEGSTGSGVQEHAPLTSCVSLGERLCSLGSRPVPAQRRPLGSQLPRDHHGSSVRDSVIPCPQASPIPGADSLTV